MGMRPATGIAFLREEGIVIIIARIDIPNDEIMSTGSGPDEVDLWWVNCVVKTQVLTAGLNLLSPDERGRSENFRRDVDRRNFIARQAALRVILARYLGLSAREITYGHNAFGKPKLLNERGAGVEFNMSQSAGLALIGVTRRTSIGVDVEALRPYSEINDVARQCFSDQELADIRGTHGDVIAERFFRLWTQKEAVLKAIGAGLSIHPNSFELRGNLAGDQDIVWRSATGDFRVPRIVKEIVPPVPGWVAAIALGKPLSKVRTFPLCDLASLIERVIPRGRSI